MGSGLLDTDDVFENSYDFIPIASKSDYQQVPEKQEDHDNQPDDEDQRPVPSSSSVQTSTTDSSSRETDPPVELFLAAKQSMCSLTQEQAYDKFKEEYIIAAQKKNPSINLNGEMTVTGPARKFVDGFLRETKRYIFEGTQIAGMTSGKSLHYYSPLAGWRSFKRRCVNVPKSFDNMPGAILKACGGKPVGFAADRSTMNNTIVATRLLLCIPKDDALKEWNVVCVIDPDDRKNIYDTNELSKYLELIQMIEKQESQALAVSRKRDKTDIPIEGEAEKKRVRTEESETKVELPLDPSLQKQVQEIIEENAFVPPEEHEFTVPIDTNQTQGEGDDKNQKTQTFGVFGPLPVITLEDDTSGNTVLYCDGCDDSLLEQIRDDRLVLFCDGPLNIQISESDYYLP